MLAPLLDTTNPFCAPSAAFFGMMGCAASLIFANLGSAYGSAKAGVGVAHLGIMDARLIMKGIVPVVMAGILGIYGLIVSIVIACSSKYSFYSYVHGI